MAVSSTTGGLRTGVCLSTDRPQNPYDGQVIYETDTNRTLVYDNAAWVVVADSQVLSIDSANGRVGVNDTSPSYALDVTGDINASGDVRVNGNPVGLVYISTKTTTGGTYVEWNGDINGGNFTNYKIIGHIDNMTISTYSDLVCRVMTSGTPVTTGYIWAGFNSYTGSAILNSANGGGSTDAWRISYVDSAAGSPSVYNNLPFEIDLYSLPDSSVASSYKANGFVPVNPLPYITQQAGTRTATAAHDGVRILLKAGTADITATLYGYTK